MIKLHITIKFKNSAVIKIHNSKFNRIRAININFSTKMMECHQADDVERKIEEKSRRLLNVTDSELF